MNPLPPNADELVSAYLDGHAAPDEIAIVESSPELLGRVEALRQVSAQLGTPVVPDAEQKEAHLAAALGAFDALFANGEVSESPPPLTVVTPAPAVASPDEPAATDAQPGVVSLETARERRKPRRFNSGVIAAAAAALLLIVGFAALSIGRSGTSQSDVATATEAVDASTDTSSDAAMDDEEEAMEDETSAESFGGLSDADSSSANAQPAPTSAPQPAQAAAPEADVAEAMEDEEAMDDEEAMADEVAEEASDDAGDSDDAAELRLGDDALDLEITPFFFGQFDDINELATALTGLSDSELEQRKGSIGEGIFARCQSLIDELAAIDTPTLLGDASVAGQPREIHAVTLPVGETVFYIVDPADSCSVIADVS